MEELIGTVSCKCSDCCVDVVRKNEKIILRGRGDSKGEIEMPEEDWKKMKMMILANEI